MRCLGASGQLGYGMPPDAFWAGIAAHPDAIGADMGSTDPGPYYLGSGKLATGVAARRSDLAMLLKGSREAGVCAVIGTAGTAGGNPHLETTLEDVAHVAKEDGLSLRVARLAAEIDPDLLHRKLESGEVRPCGLAPALTHDEIDRAVRLVGQMGVEPIMEALAMQPDAVVAGRCCDTAVFAAAPLLAGLDRGPATHLAKIIECASQCADPGGRDAIMGDLEDGSFLVQSLNPGRRCTPLSVAAHSLYEQLDPAIVSEPGGYLDLTSCAYEAKTDHATRVRGSRWVQQDDYWVKIEGVSLEGYRAFTLGAMRDPVAIRELDAILEGVRAHVGRTLPPGTTAEDFRMRFMVYGRDGVLGALEPSVGETPHEVMVVTDVVASDPEQARSICGAAKQMMLHYFYEGIMATGGNLAIPFGPDVHDGGAVYSFNVYHLVRLEDPLELFPIEEVVLG